MTTLHRLDDRLLADVNDLARHTGWLHGAILAYAGDSSRAVADAAPRRSSSRWISPTPPPISRTVAPSRSDCASASTIRRAVRSSPRLR